MREDDMARELEDWIERTFAMDRAVAKDEVLRRASDAGLPREEMDLLAQLPQASQTRPELVDEIERMTSPHLIGGSAGGMEAGSSGERRPGAYGAEPTKRYGGDQSGGYEP